MTMELKGRSRGRNIPKENRDSQKRQFRALWREILNWRRHWNLRSFFEALIFGLLFTLLDTGTDFKFAWSVPEICSTDSVSIEFDPIGLNPCGIVDYKDVEYSTYTVIALPGLFFAFSLLQKLSKDLMSWITGGEAEGCFKATAISLFLLGQIFLLFFLNFAAMRAEDWTQDPDVPKSWVEAYSFSIKGMAYTSAAFMVGVKILGLFCHGPEVSSLVLQTCNAEAQLEAAYQLFLLSTLFLSSGRWTTEGIRSGVTSLLVIGKVGVANLFTEEKEELKEASFLRKICIATSFLPVFILTTLFKIGSLSVLVAWREGGLEEVFLFLLAVALPACVLVLLKIRLHLPDMTVTDISQGLVSERVSLHIWPARETGKRIGLALAALHLVLGRVGQHLCQEGCLLVLEVSRQLRNCTVSG